jgi:uncharacterized membrane protein
MKVHLVGSIGLDTVEDVFRAVGKEPLSRAGAGWRSRWMHALDQLAVSAAACQHLPAARSVRQSASDQSQPPSAAWRARSEQITRALLRIHAECCAAG